MPNFLDQTLIGRDAIGHIVYISKRFIFFQLNNTNPYITLMSVYILADHILEVWR